MTLIVCHSLWGWSMVPPLFRRCFLEARPVGTERGVEEVRRKVEASIDQPGRAWQLIGGVNVCLVLNKLTLPKVKL